MPANLIDSLGLYSWWDFGEDTLNFVAGVGNAVSFGGTTYLAEQFMNEGDRQILRKAKQSGSFEAGEWASLGLGGGRLAYAGTAKTASLLYRSKGATEAVARSAVNFRNGLKQAFRLNPWSKFRVYPFEKIAAKYGHDWGKIIDAAGRTNGPLNLLGAILAAGGIKGLTDGETNESTTSDCL